MARQLRLRLRRSGVFTRAGIVEGDSNVQATAAIDLWPRWPSQCLVLVGPAGVGKTHLARAWADQVDAAVLDRASPDLAKAAGRPVLLEDADRGVADEALFHLINLAQRDGGGLLLTARTPPALWSVALADLRSRLNALFVAAIEEPDDAVLEGVLRKFFEERNIRPAPQLYPYLIRRIARSALSAREIVRRLDEAPDELKPVSRDLARKLLDAD